MGNNYTIVYTLHATDLSKNSCSEIYNEIDEADKFLNRILGNAEIDVPECMVTNILDAVKKSI